MWQPMDRTLYVDEKEGKLIPTNNVYTPFFNVGLANMVSVLEDREQNLWLGCFQKGVVMVPTRPTSFHYWDLLKKNIIREIILDSTVRIMEL